MNPLEQMAFVRELGKNVIGEIVQNILDGKIPPEWGGAELSTLIADRFDRVKTTSTMSAQRKAAYLKAIIENNL
jgi:hypothetical protein